VAQRIGHVLHGVDILLDLHRAVRMDSFVLALLPSSMHQNSARCGTGRARSPVSALHTLALHWVGAKSITSVGASAKVSGSERVGFELHPHRTRGDAEFLRDLRDIAPKAAQR
jgi:hypothetical protein